MHSVPKYVKQILAELKGGRNSNAVVAGDLNTPLSTMDTSSRWRTNKETADLNNAID